MFRRYYPHLLALVFFVFILLLGLSFIMSVAAGYEIIEWCEGGQAGIEFSGSQGDIWNAQKDMLADTLGAITTVLLFWLVRPDRTGKMMGGK